MSDTLQSRTPPVLHPALSPLLFLLAACVSSTAPPVDSLSEAVPWLMEQAGVPGAAIAIVDGTRVRTHHYGVASVETATPVDEGTIFEAASLSKPVFVWAVMQLVDQGRLELDRPLASYVEEPYLNDPRAAVITARMVLTHHTGLPNWRPRDKDLELVFEPGTRFSYSGEGFVYLQRAVESITSAPLDTVMRSLVFDPLGMSASSYDWRPEYDDIKAWGHNALGESPARRKPDRSLSAATLHTTASDLGRFLSAVLTAQRLSPSSQKAMLSPQVAAPVDCANCARRTAKVADSEEIFWGLGWGLVKTGEGFNAWHWGDNGNFKAYLYGDPRARRGVVVLINGASGLSIAGEIAAIAMSGTPDPSHAHEPLDWLNYPRWDSPSQLAFHRIAKEGEPALEWLRRQAFAEAEINDLGYELLRTARTREAVAVFRLNTQKHSESWNVWDSLGDALISAGDRAGAAAAYAESVRLKPDSPSGNDALRILAGDEKLDSELVPKITGRYVFESGTAELRHDDETMQLALEGELFPLIVISPSRFIGARATLHVQLSGDGKLTIVRDGQRIDARKPE